MSASCHIYWQEATQMRKLQISDSEIMGIAVQQEIFRSEESRYDHRLHGILLMTQGLTCYEVADILGQNPRTVERWVQRFENSGFAALREGEREGRPRRLGDLQLEAVNRDLRRNPREFGHDQNLWDGKLLAHHLHKFHGIRLGARQCQRLFRQMGFRLRKPRPLIAHADPGAQAAFKKTPSLGPRRKT
jgi:transposase